MNGSLHSPPNVVSIKLKRGPAGLGFNIVGGVDQQYVVDDSGIYVSKIKEDGAAGQDGRLQEGDKILEINRVKLENKRHKDVVEMFRTAGEDVELRVLKKSLHHMNGPTDSQPDQESSLSYLKALLAVAGTVAVIAILYKHRFRRPF